ncbi:MAG: DUF4270 domain-containing protein [Bacteroidaceae bacterium]|jgi:hypothetical protein|nr:DUF4270 domain-containing protein [Bacteroidaceae bacterium]
MNLKPFYITALLFTTFLIFIACDDNTDTLGSDLMPSSDIVVKESRTYDVYTQSYSAGDSVLARSSRSYLGQFTDPETGTIIKSDFLAQFHCIDDFSFPDSIVGDSILSTDLKLYVTKYVGDSLATFKISVYPLTKIMNPDADYYTNINPALYCDTSVAPIAEKWFTLSDRTISDSERNKSTYKNRIVIPLPNSVGKQIRAAWDSNPEYFDDSEAWINSGLPGSKGFYFKLESGDGALAYINIVQFNINYRYHLWDEDKDTTGSCQFAATEEVIQATHFANYNLEKLLKDNTSTYLKSPAGIFTMATLPIDQILTTDTINQAKLVLTRYNDIINSGFRLDIPKYLLLVRLDDYNKGFFENYHLADAKSSYLCMFNSANNTYTFNNISHLIGTMKRELHNGTATANYNKVLLIPVEPTFDSSTASTQNLVKLCHDFSMTSARLVGGTNPVKLEIIYSKFAK